MKCPKCGMEIPGSAVCPYCHEDLGSQHFMNLYNAHPLAGDIILAIIGYVVAFFARDNAMFLILALIFAGCFTATAIIRFKNK